MLIGSTIFGSAMTEIRHRGFCTLCRSRCGAIFIAEDGHLKEVVPIAITRP